jgi:hypothetical protein
MQKMQPAMESGPPPEAMAGFSPLQTINDATLSAYSHVYASVAARAYTVAEQWEGLSALRRVGHSVGRLVGNTFGLWMANQSARAGGFVADSLDDLPLLDLPSLPSIRQARTAEAGGTTAYDPAVHAIPSWHIQSEKVEPMQLVAPPEELDLVAVAHTETDRPSKYGYDFELASNIDRAPNSLPLDEWNGKTGHGTVWNQTLAYSDELGFSNLDEQQKRQMTQKMLDFNGLTWAEARDLGTDYEPKLPTQRVMEGWLAEVGAERTFEADRPDPPVTTGDPGGRGSGPDPGAGREDTAQPPPPGREDDDCHRPGWVTWIPWFDCRADYKDWIMGLVLAGVAVAGYAGNQKRRGRPFVSRRTRTTRTTTSSGP